MRKLLSIFVALVMVFSLATVASAASENKNAEIYYDIQWSADWECYALKCYLKLDGGLDLVKSGPRYTGAGLYSFMVTFNGVTVDDFMYSDAMSERGTGFIFGTETLGDGFYTYGGQCAGTVQDMHKSTANAPVELFTLYVAGDDVDAIEAKFSDLGYSAFKIGNVSGITGGTTVTADMLTTYAVGDDGVTQHVDADYVVVTPEAGSTPEPEEEKVVMTATPFITDVAESTEAAGWQKGQAVALQFKTADLAEFVAMNWKLTVAGANKFAKVDDAAFATIKATAAETVDVFASFVVNTAENTEATPITAVSAGFKKADGTVVEAE